MVKEGKHQRRVYDLLGMRLVNPSKSLIAKHGLWSGAPGPVVLSVSDPSIFLFDDESTAPTLGCMFTCMSFGGFIFSYKTPLARKFRIRTVRQFAREILNRAISPRRHRELIAEAAARLLKEASARPHDLEGQAWRLHSREVMRIPPQARSRYICGVVYGLPKHQGTMTTYLRLTEAHMDSVRRWLAGVAT